MTRKMALVCLTLALVLGVSGAAWGQKATVLRVVVVKTDNMAAYVDAIGKGREIMKKLGSPAVTRVWQARFAGPEAGTVVVSIEYPSVAAFAEDYARIGGSAEYQEWLKGLSKIRTIVSDSLYNEW